MYYVVGGVGGGVTPICFGNNIYIYIFSKSDATLLHNLIPFQGMVSMLCSIILAVNRSFTKGSSNNVNNSNKQRTQN